MLRTKFEEFLKSPVVDVVVVILDVVVAAGVRLSATNI